MVLNLKNKADVDRQEPFVSAKNSWTRIKVWHGAFWSFSLYNILQTLQYTAVILGVYSCEHTVIALYKKSEHDLNVQFRTMNFHLRVIDIP